MSGKQGEWCMIGVYSEGECMRCCLRDKPLTLMRYHSFMKLWKGGKLSVAKPTIEEHKREHFF